MASHPVKLILMSIVMRTSDLKGFLAHLSSVFVLIPRIFQISQLDPKRFTFVVKRLVQNAELHGTRG
jgi:hypothetical protein